MWNIGWAAKSLIWCNFIWGEFAYITFNLDSVSWRRIKLFTLNGKNKQLLQPIWATKQLWPIPNQDNLISADEMMMRETHLTPGHVSGSTSLTSDNLPKSATQTILEKVLTDWLIVTDCFSLILLPVLSSTFCLRKCLAWFTFCHQCSTLFTVQLLSSLHTFTRLTLRELSSVDWWHCWLRPAWSS